MSVPRPAWPLLAVVPLGARAVFAQHAGTPPESSTTGETTGPRLSLRGFTNVDYALREQGRPTRSRWGSSTCS